MFIIFEFLIRHSMTSRHGFRDAARPHTDPADRNARHTAPLSPPANPTAGIRFGIIGIFLFLTSIRNSIASDLSPTPTGNIGTVPEITLLRISSYKYIKSILTHAYSAHFFFGSNHKKIVWDNQRIHLEKSSLRMKIRREQWLIQNSSP